MDYLKKYWKENREFLYNEKSIKKIYENYKKTTETPVNEYRFRSFIRKNGYCNSCNEEIMCKKCTKNSVLVS